MKRILILAALLGAASLSGSAFAYNYVYRVPGADGAPGAPQPTAGPLDEQTVYSSAISEEVGAPEEQGKLISGSIVGSWADGFGQGGDVWQLNQVWLTSEKIARTEPGMVDFGYRVDALFGTNILQSSDGFDGKWGVSGDGYGASIYQAYGEIGWGKLALKGGKFGTNIGIESVDASANDFATHSHMFRHEPATHTGGLFTFHATDNFSLDFGMVSGVDNSFDNRRGDTGFLFGANLDLAENVSVSYAGALSQVHSELGENRAATSWGYYDDLFGVPVGDNDEYLQTITATINFTDKFSYSFATNYGTMSDRRAHDARYGQLGFANYFGYQLTECLKAAVRYEYYTQWLEDAGKPFGAFAPWAERRQNIHDVSFSLVYKPIENIFILPEVRYDWIETGDVKNHFSVKDDGLTGAVACGIVF